MNKLPMLIQREFWEHRNTFMVVPFLTTVFLMLMMVVLFAVSLSDLVDVNVDINVDGEGDRGAVVFTDNAVAYVLDELNDMSERSREQRLNDGLQALSAPLVAILWFVIFFYLLASLYDDRRDRSILFWKSLPVSDAMTVISKLITGVLIVPFVYFLGIAALQLTAIILLTLGAIGTDYPIWDTLWGPASLFGNWFTYIGAVFFYSLWALPFFGWLAAVSSFAKSVPLVWAMGIPFAISIAERIFTSQSAVADWMGNHVIPVRFLRHVTMNETDMSRQFLSLEMLSAVVVGVALVFLAIWLRGRADEI